MFSTFPGGLPGSGLLLLRATLGITILVQEVYLSELSVPNFRTWFAGIPAVVCGVLLLVGFLTPAAGAILFIGWSINAFFLFSLVAPDLNIPALYTFYGLVLSAAAVLLGPGAFSLDARLFGRREIIIPKN